MANPGHGTPKISSSSPLLLSQKVRSLGPTCIGHVLPHPGPIHHGWEPPKLQAKINLSVNSESQVFVIVTEI